MLSVRANDRGATPVGNVEVESRIRGNVYVRFGEGLTGDLTETPRFLFHQNLGAALDEVFTTHHQTLDAVHAALRQQPVPLPDGTVAVPVLPAETPRPAQQRATQRQARRQTTYEQVWALRRQGWTVPAIVQQVGVSRRTVFRYLRTTTCPAPKHRSDYGDSLLNPYKPYLLERWNAGCYTAMWLLRDLRQRGYAGGYGVVAAYARRLRQAQGLPRGHAAHTSPCRPWTSRRASP